jgi:GNAT superfamily N-acetyltransferase
MDEFSGLRADPHLVEKWLRARSVSRGLPQPVPESGGFRVETGLPAERRRHVFPAWSEGLRRVAESITDPHVFLKFCGPEAVLMEALPAGWQSRPLGYVMTGPLAHARRPGLPEGYRLDLSREGPVTVVRIEAADGTQAAGGRAVSRDGVFIYDQIRTDAAHRRRGLGTAVMVTLEAHGRHASDSQVLVATPEGRSLYATLGWRVHSLYSTAVIPP